MDFLITGGLGVSFTGVVGADENEAPRLRESLTPFVAEIVRGSFDVEEGIFEVELGSVFFPISVLVGVGAITGVRDELKK